MTDLREGFASLEEGVRAAVLGVRAQMWTSLPGIIVSYDAAKNTAEVQPAVQGIRRKEDGKLEYETLPVCPAGVWGCRPVRCLVTGASTATFMMWILPMPPPSAPPTRPAAATLACNT